MRNSASGSALVRALAWLLLAAWLAGSMLLAWLLLVYPNRTPKVAGRDTPMRIEPGSSIDEVARELARENVIAEPRAFVAFARLLGADRKLRSGFIVVNRALSPRALLPRIARGFGSASVMVPIPEGFTQFDVAARLARYGVAPRHALLAAMHDRELLARLDVPALSAEGYLFPAHYSFALDSAPERVVERMVKTFHARTAELFARHASLENAFPSARLTAHEIVILASIVEREARLAEERATIAGVFLNRMLDPDFRPKRLQADPTVAYGCLVAGPRVPSCREFDGRVITPAMVRDAANPYSTYRHEGLPPGPIANPGMAALRAAVMPEPHDFLYFVATGRGRHAFASTLDEHNRNIHSPAESSEATKPAE